MWPFIVKRVGWRAAGLATAVMCVGYVSFLAAGSKVFAGLFLFARAWQFDAGPFALSQWLSSVVTPHPEAAARALSGFACFAVLVWQAKHDDGRAESFVRRSALTLGALVVFSPTVMPWYVTWILPLAVLAEQRVWGYFSALASVRGDPKLLLSTGKEKPMKAGDQTMKGKASLAVADLPTGQPVKVTYRVAERVVTQVTLMAAKK